MVEIFGGHIVVFGRNLFRLAVSSIVFAGLASVTGCHHYLLNPLAARAPKIKAMEKFRTLIPSTISIGRSTTTHWATRFP